MTLPEEPGKAVPPDPPSEPVPVPPNKFATLVDEAASIALLVDEDANSNMAMDDTVATLSAQDYDGDDESYSDDEGVITKPDSPQDPDTVDELPSPASANDRWEQHLFKSCYTTLF